MFHKILVCTDGSASALEATRLGAEIARHLNAEALVLNVFDVIYTDAAYMGVWAMTIDQESLDRCAQAQREAVENLARHHFERAGVSYQFVQKQGHPVDCILDVAKRESVDLIVIGSRGLGGLKEFFLGSVSNGVLHHAPCPVLIARGDNAPEGTGEFRHVLLASDTSETANKATAAAVQIAQAFATSLTVLNVFEEFPDLIHLPDYADDADDVLADFSPEHYARHLLETVKKQTTCAAEGTGVYCDFHQEKGHPGETIVRFANEHLSDLIVLGSRGLAGFTEMLLGSVSNYVANHAKCSVLVMH